MERTNEGGIPKCIREDSMAENVTESKVLDLDKNDVESFAVFRRLLRYVAGCVLVGWWTFSHGSQIEKNVFFHQKSRRDASDLTHGVCERGRSLERSLVSCWSF